MVKKKCEHIANQFFWRHSPLHTLYKLYPLSTIINVLSSEAIGIEIMPYVVVFML